MSRKELYDLVKSLRESGFIFSDEADAFKEVISKSNTSDLDALHDTIMEAAEDSATVKQDIQSIAEVIYPTFSSENEAREFAKENLNISFLGLEGFDIYGIYNRKSMYGVSAEDYVNHKVYHIIVKVSYSGELFGFGYNEAQNSLSYTIDSSGPYFDRVPPFEYDKRIEFIKNSIEYTIGVL